MFHENLKTLRKNKGMSQEQLSRLNDLIATQIQDRRNLGRKIKNAVIIAGIFIFIIAIYPSWCDMWHEFGGNLYHLLND